MFPLIVNSAKNLTNYIERETDVDKLKMFDARDFTVRFTSDAIYSCLYGIDAKSFDREKSLMLEYGRKFLKGIMNSLVSSFPLQMVSKDVENFFANLTIDAIKYRTDNNFGQDDMLAHAVVLKQVKNLSDLEILGHCMTLFLNSFETSALTFQNMLYQLGMNSKIQEKLRSEIIEKIKTDEDFTYENVIALSYLDQVFYETLRLHPGLVFTTRVSTEDINIKGSDGTDLMLKKNSAIWIPIHSIHRDAGEKKPTENSENSKSQYFANVFLEYYPNPEKFIPERFDPEHGGVKAFADRCILIPFGDGGRICPGKKFAHIEVKTAVVEVLRKFEVFIDKNTSNALKISPHEFMNIPDKNVLINFKKI